MEIKKFITYEYVWVIVYMKKLSKTIGIHLSMTVGGMKVTYRAKLSVKENKNEFYPTLVRLVGFYGISTLLGYLMLNPFLCIYINHL